MEKKAACPVGLVVGRNNLPDHYIHLPRTVGQSLMSSPAPIFLVKLLAIVTLLGIKNHAFHLNLVTLLPSKYTSKLLAKLPLGWPLVNIASKAFWKSTWHWFFAISGTFSRQSVFTFIGYINKVVSYNILESIWSVKFYGSYKLQPKVIPVY